MTWVALDAMGGDFGPALTVPAAISAMKSDDALSVILVGKPDHLEPFIANLPNALRLRLRVEAASEVITMDDDPMKALRRKTDSSMHRALQLVKDSQAGACVSAGNTGALVTIAHVLLRTLPGIKRAALMARMPNRSGGITYMLDLGGNLEVSPQQLLQFAAMGSSYLMGIHHIESPRVALLNVGVESIKGNECVKSANALLKNSRLNYVGYIEGNHLYDNWAEVIVCDGFVGNAVLKASEGTAKLIGDYLHMNLKRHLFTQLLGVLGMPVFKRLKREINPSYLNGASLLGLRGTVIKSHGSADNLGLVHAILLAAQQARWDLPSRIEASLPDVGQEDV